MVDVSLISAPPQRGWGLRSTIARSLSSPSAQAIQANKQTQASKSKHLGEAPVAAEKRSRHNPLHKNSTSSRAAWGVPPALIIQRASHRGAWGKKLNLKTANHKRFLLLFLSSFLSSSSPGGPPFSLRGGMTPSEGRRAAAQPPRATPSAARRTGCRCRPTRPRRGRRRRRHH